MKSPSVGHVGRTYGFVFYSLHRWYAKQGDEGAEGAEWYAWATLSYFGTATLVAVESALAFVDWQPMLMFSEGLPAVVRYAWSFPLFLVLNFSLFIARDTWRSIVACFEAMDSRRVLVRYRLVGISLHVLFFASLGLAILAPS